jgi:hypothetical protein
MLEAPAVANASKPSRGWNQWSVRSTSARAYGLEEVHRTDEWVENRHPKHLRRIN